MAQHRRRGNHYMQRFLSSVLSRSRAIGAALAAMVGLTADSMTRGPEQDTRESPVRRNSRAPERRHRWARLVWNSSELGAAYLLYDAQGRKLYVPLKSIPAAKRLPRAHRRSGAVVAEVRRRTVTA